MKRILLAIITFLLFSLPSYADHIKGGFFSYEYLGPGASDPVNNVRYRVTLTIYMVCNPTTGQLTNPINFTVFNSTGSFLQNVSVSIAKQYNLNKLSDEVCISGNQQGCYYTIVVYDLSSIELPRSATGYIFSYQRCCRIAGIQNLISPSNSIGNTFSITIPGTSVAPAAETNSSPVFPINDTAVVCSGSPFSYSFQATDPNSDSLAYNFCDAMQGASQSASTPTTALSPPYSPVPYQSPFNGGQPMGPDVTIDPKTGLISGLAPGLTGEYVVCVCVSEYRDGILLGVTRKELHIQVKDCEPLNALLAPKPTTCDGFVVTFSNDVGNPPGTTYHWTFGEPSTGSLDTSFSEITSHEYTAAGIYNVRLRVSIAGLCIDSADLKVNVFPGFFPGFEAKGGCFMNPYKFTDTTKTNFGVVNSWSWNFGDLGTAADTSHLQNPQWTYSSPGIKTVTLTVTNDKGCIKTISFPVDVLDKPIVTMDFKDTLICIPDPVTLGASGTGTFSWTPTTSITNANSPNPTVNPTTTTWYVATLTDNGCTNKDSVRVRVVANVTLAAMGDTIICLNDQAQLRLITDALSFQWTPVESLDDETKMNPIATPAASTPYQVKASIGSCSAFENITVTTVPYPVANAGAPQIICYNTSAQLNGSHDGSSFSWSPVSYLNDSTILNPISNPPRTTSYVLSAFDTKGCPKPGRDTVVITVNPKVRAYAGRDTVVVVGQPLQLNGTGGVDYLWSPGTGLNRTDIPNPVGIYNSFVDTVKYKLIVTDALGCSDSAYVTVSVFLTRPSVFVPTAFTPNGDGKNDVVRPIAVGIQRINYFSVYNRWGQLVFTTTVDRAGWDGRIKGQLQNTGVFVWMVSAVDYLGTNIFLKGTVALIR